MPSRIKCLGRGNGSEGKERVFLHLGDGKALTSHQCFYRGKGLRSSVRACGVLSHDILKYHIQKSQ